MSKKKINFLKDYFWAFLAFIWTGQLRKIDRRHGEKDKG